MGTNSECPRDPRQVSKPRGRTPLLLHESPVLLPTSGRRNRDCTPSQYQCVPLLPHASHINSSVSLAALRAPDHCLLVRWLKSWIHSSWKARGALSCPSPPSPSSLSCMLQALSRTRMTPQTLHTRLPTFSVILRQHDALCPASRQDRRGCRRRTRRAWPFLCG